MTLASGPRVLSRQHRAPGRLGLGQTAGCTGPQLSSGPPAEGRTGLWCPAAPTTRTGRAGPLGRPLSAGDGAGHTGKVGDWHRGPGEWMVGRGPRCKPLSRLRLCRSMSLPLCLGTLFQSRIELRLCGTVVHSGAAGPLSGTSAGDFTSFSLSAPSVK